MCSQKFYEVRDSFKNDLLIKVLKSKLYRDFEVCHKNTNTNIHTYSRYLEIGILKKILGKRANFLRGFFPSEWGTVFLEKHWKVKYILCCKNVYIDSFTRITLNTL